MHLSLRPVLTIVGFCAVLAAAPSHAAVTFDWAMVGGPGNAAESHGYGAVGYTYSISKTEVTNAQWVEFLNAVAPSDPHGLYGPITAGSTRGGIVRSGTNGNYIYAVKSPDAGVGPGGGDYTYANKPVTQVSWYDAARFTNWLHNGQGNGSTETGVYDMSQVNPTRSANASYALPSENEWYKAAYYDPATQTYYDYATGSNTAPNNNLPSSDTGNSANFKINFTGYTTGNWRYPLTDVGAYQNSASPNGTFDQQGNVLEWNERLFGSGSTRGEFGGSWDSNLHSAYSNWTNNSASTEDSYTGFRVVMVPEPTNLGIAIIFGAGILRRRFRQA